MLSNLVQTMTFLIKVLGENMLKFQPNRLINEAGCIILFVGNVPFTICFYVFGVLLLNGLQCG